MLSNLNMDVLFDRYLKFIIDKTRRRQLLNSIFRESIAEILLICQISSKWMGRLSFGNRLQRDLG